MPQINPSLPTIGQPDSSEEPKIVTALSQLISAVNTVDSAQIVDGVIQPVDLQSALADKLGISTGVIRRGKSIIPTAESLATSAAYGLMPTPDQVANIVLPTDGLLFVAYQATWQQSVSSSLLEAVICLNGTPTVEAANTTAPVVVSAATSAGVAGRDMPLSSYWAGLHTVNAQNAAYGGDVTTGQVVGTGSSLETGGPSTIFAAAGTYTVSVQFRVASGNLTVKGRKLWVWSMAF